MSGLDDLATQRAKATKRTMPPPKTPARSTPVQLPQTTATAPTELPPAIPTAAPAAPSALPAPAKAAAQQQSEELARYSIYLDTTLDDYLTDVLNAGRKRRPKIAVSRSAVVRLALTELAGRMDPDAAAAEIADKAPAAVGTGRRRL